jgi:hypothetical protein
MVGLSMVFLALVQNYFKTKVFYRYKSIVFPCLSTVL